MHNFCRLNRIFSSILAALFCVCLLAACGYSSEEKQQMSSYEKNAKANAVKYIEDKYGFTPKVLDATALKVDSGPVPDFSPAASGRVKVSMRYGDTVFCVNISGEENMTDGRDDYQREEIVDAFKKELSEKTSLEIAEIDVRYTDDNLLEEYFTDVDSFFVDSQGKIVVSIVVKTLDDITESTVQNITYDKVELLIVSCEDKNDLAVLSGFEYLNDQGYRNNFYNIDFMNRKLLEYAYYMKGHVFRSKEGEVSCKLYAHEAIGENMYLIYDKQSGNASVDRTSDMAEAVEWSKASGHADIWSTFDNPEKISQSYKVDFGDLSEVQILLKRESRVPSDSYERYVALQYTDESGKEIFTRIATVFEEEFYTFTLDRQENLRFALMIDKKW